MRTSTLRRLVTTAVSTAVAGAALAAPASADDRPEWQADVELAQGSVFADVSDATLGVMIHHACGATTSHVSSSSVDDIAYASSGAEAESLLISATVDLDGEGGWDKTCTFGVIETDIRGPHATHLTGSYRFTASSAVDAEKTIELPLAESNQTYTPPIFTDLDEWASASLTSTGHRIEQTPGTVMVPGVPKTASEISRAKQSRAKYLKHAKTTYSKSKKKAGKIKSKSKRNKAKAAATARYRKQVRTAERNYQRAVATPPATAQRGLVPSAKAFSMTSTL